MAAGLRNIKLPNFKLNFFREIQFLYSYKNIEFVVFILNFVYCSLTLIKIK